MGRVSPWPTGSEFWGRAPPQASPTFSGLLRHDAVGSPRARCQCPAAGQDGGSGGPSKKLGKAWLPPSLGPE